LLQSQGAIFLLSSPFFLQLVQATQTLLLMRSAPKNFFNEEKSVLIDKQNSKLHFSTENT